MVRGGDCTIDERGWHAQQRKFAIAHRAYHRAIEFGIPPYEIFFDPLALPISTGIEEDRANASATITAIRRAKNCPVVTSFWEFQYFGLNPAARLVLNSMFLHLATEAGMDAAIVSA